MATASPPRHCTRCGTRLARDNRQVLCGGCQRAARDALLRPPRVPRAFWDVDQMRDALATWHMGRVIYAYRTHPFHGQTIKQQIVANWFELTQAQLSRLENHSAPEDLGKLIRYARILQIPGELLWFKLPEEREATVAASQPAAPNTLVLPVMVDGRGVLLPLSGAAVGAAALGLRLDGFHSTRQQAAGEGGGVFSMQQRFALPERSPTNGGATLDTDEVQHVAAALEDARRYFDGSVVEYFRRQLDHCKADDGHRGPAAALPLVLGILTAVQAQVRDVKPAVQRALLTLGADGAEFAAWLCRDLRNPRAAEYWLDRAVEWAQEAGDLPMQGWILLKKSQMA